jgi:peptidoglycan/xylan/chitin deacetylase (PgdA/CDA1 family)
MEFCLYKFIVKRERKMSRKIRIAGLSIIVLIIIAMFCTMGVVQAKTVANVEKTVITNSNASSVGLSWKKVSAADGYYIYQSTDSKNFEKVATINDPSSIEYSAKDLTQATKYDFYVTAFKKSKSGVESKEYQVISACTLPLQQNVKASSPDAGQLDITWDSNESASGYQLEYVEGDGSDFSSAQKVNVKDNKTVEQLISDLTAKKTYSVRVRSYLTYNDETLNGEWSKTACVEIADKIAMSSDIDPTKPMIALTFDDGPGYNTASDKILDVLEKYNARATFFMVGKNAADHPENLKRKVEMGCEIGNHTYAHDHYGKNVTASDIKKASEAIYKACGQYPTAFRSTGGNTTDVILKECKAENMPLYYWSIDTEDWKSRDANKIYNKVMKNVGDGDIILMHEIYDSTAEAVEKMVPKLIEQGYQLVTCEELIQAKTGKNPQVAQQYVNATTINNKTS